jgi:hypothetical protein
MDKYSPGRGHYRAAAVIILAVAFLLAAATSALAQSGGGYDLSWGTIDGGGATFGTGGGYSLGGTIGQPDAGAMSGGVYTEGGGFWAGVKALFYRYAPLTLKN